MPRRCPNGSKGKIETHLRRAWEPITPTYYKCDQYRADPLQWWGGSCKLLLTIGATQEKKRVTPVPKGRRRRRRRGQLTQAFPKTYLTLLL